MGSRAEKCVRKSEQDLNGRELVVEMKHITAISQEGENVILGFR